MARYLSLETKPRSTSSEGQETQDRFVFQQRSSLNSPLWAEVMWISPTLSKWPTLGMTDRSRDLAHGQSSGSVLHGQPGYDAVNSMIADGMLIPFPPSRLPCSRMAHRCLACVPEEPRFKRTVPHAQQHRSRRVDITQTSTFGRLVELGPSQRALNR